MKQTLLLVLLLLLLLTEQSHCQIITVKIPEYSNQSIVLAIHNGDFPKTLIKETTNTNGIVEFTPHEMKSGIYYIILPDSTAYEFMYDINTPGNIEISIKKQQTTLIKAPSTTQSYAYYTNEMNNIANKEDSLRILLKQNDLKKKELKGSFLMRDELKNKRIDLQKSLLLEYDTLLLGKYIRSFIKVKIPPYTPPNDVVNVDSAIWMWQLQYYKKHYLDNMDLSSPDLINTPVYTEKVNHYLNKICLQKADDLIKTADYTINKAQSNALTNEFLTNYLLVKYSQLKNQPEYEFVYLHIIEKYYLSGIAVWMSKNDINLLAREYNQRKPLCLGQKAPPIENLENEAGKKVSLKSIKAEYTIIYFHNYDCSICKTTGSELLKLMFKVDPKRIKTFAVCLGEKESKCKSYSKKFGMVNWINGFDETQSSSIATKYALSYTPTFYVLDADKRIITKNITIQQLEQWIKSVE